MEVTALEIIARASREGAYRDPRDPKGTRPGVTYADITGALGYVHDSWAADMALMIGTRDARNADKAKEVLHAYVYEECLRDGIRKPDDAAIAIGVERAISDAIFSPAGERGGSRYYRWAMAHLMSRAEAAAEEAVRKALGLRRAA